MPCRNDNRTCRTVSDNRAGVYSQASSSARACLSSGGSAANCCAKSAKAGFSAQMVSLALTGGTGGHLSLLPAIGCPRLPSSLPNESVERFQRPDLR